MRKFLRWITNPIRRINSFYFLWKTLKNPKVKKDINFKFLCELIFTYYKKGRVTKYERNLAAAVIRKLRPIFPYYIQGWGKNKKVYEEYFKREDAIQSLTDIKKGDYVTRFKNESVYPTENPFKFHSVDTYGKNKPTYKVEKLGKYIRFENHSNDLTSLDEEWHTAYRWATPEEIEVYEVEKSRRKKIEKQIKQKQEELSNLYKQLNA